jgi:hypothetical protein
MTTTPTKPALPEAISIDGLNDRIIRATRGSRDLLRQH